MQSRGKNQLEINVKTSNRAKSVGAQRSNQKIGIGSNQEMNNQEFQQANGNIAL
jgi:hypothetical protein